MQVRIPVEGTRALPQDPVAAPTGSSGHSRGLHHSLSSARWHPRCICSTRGVPRSQPWAWAPWPVPSGAREEGCRKYHAHCGSGQPDMEQDCLGLGGRSFSYLGLCPTDSGLGLRNWLHRDVKAACLVQGCFFSELCIGQVSAPAPGLGSASP